MGDEEGDDPVIVPVPVPGGGKPANDDKPQTPDDPAPGSPDGGDAA